MKIIGIVAWISAWICALGSVGYLLAAIRQPGRMGFITVLCVWVSAIWPFFFPAFNRVHLLWLVPFSFFLPTIVNFGTLRFRSRYAWWRLGNATPLEKLHKLTAPSASPFPFSPTVFILSIALYVLILRLL